MSSEPVCFAGLLRPRVGSDSPACHAPVAPPYDIVVNAIRRELAHQLTTPEELLEIPTCLPNVL